MDIVRYCVCVALRLMLTFRKGYFLLAVLLLVVEVLIALFAHDRFIRPYIGDLLAVTLLYCLVRAFFKTGISATAIGCLAFAFFEEFLQYLKIVEVLGWQDSELARVIIGTSFVWEDLVAYAAGISLVFAAEWLVAKWRA